MANAEIACAPARFNHNPENPYVGMNQSALFDAARGVRKNMKQAKSAALDGTGTAAELLDAATELGRIWAAEGDGLWFVYIDPATYAVWIGRDIAGEETGERRADVRYC